MKKLVYSFLFALILPLLVFTGCGGTPKSKATFYVDGSLYTTIEFEQQKSFDLPHAPEKDGYYQIGWESNGMIFGLDAPYYGGMSNVSFYAVYKPTALKITHNNIEGIQVDNFGTSFNITLADGIETFDLAQVLNMSPEATWDIPNDNNNYCQISGTTVTLYQSSTYISITGSYLGDTVEYHINIMNYSILPRYALTFNGVDDPVYVRQGQTINPEDIPELPEHYDEDYIAASWDFDFSTPIYSDQYINYVIDQKYKHVEYYVDGELVHTSEELAYGDTATLYDRFQFTKTHYYTELWNTKPDFSGSTVGYDFSFDADYHALYLEFRPITYTVYIQNTAGATKEDGDVFYALYYTIESSTGDLTLPEISKNYNNFVGYQDAEGNYYNVFPIEKIGELDELTAVWDPIKYNITYVLNGGTNNDQNPDYVVCDTHYEFVAPTKDCYEFAGWHTTPECNDPKPTTTMYTAVPEEKTFYAKWNMINYQVRYIINHDEYLQNQDELVSTISINNHTVIATEQTGFTFNYFTDNENNNITTEKDGIISVNTSYMAKTTYDKNYEAYVIFLKTNATPIQYPITYLSDKPVGNNPNKTTYTILEAVSLAEPTSTGYEFVKFTDNNGLTTTGINKGQTGAKTINLNWEIINYNLSFVSLDPDIDYYISSAYDKYNIESDFEFDNFQFSHIEQGYAFNAFYNDTEKTEAITGITPGETGDKVIYIDFDVAVYTITYQNTQGGILYRNSTLLYDNFTTTYTYFDTNKTSLGYLYREYYDMRYLIVEGGDSAGYYIEWDTTINYIATDIIVEPVYESIFDVEEGIITHFNSSNYRWFYPIFPHDSTTTFPAKINGETITGFSASLSDFNILVDTLIFPEGYSTLAGNIKTTAREIVLPSTLTYLYKHFIQGIYCPNLTICDVSHTKLTDWDNALPNTVTTVVLPATLINFKDKLIRDYTFPKNLQSLIFESDSEAAKGEVLDLSHIVDLKTLNINDRFKYVKISPSAAVLSTQGCDKTTVEVVSADKKTCSSNTILAEKVIIGDNIDIEVSRCSLTSLIVGDNCDISIIDDYQYIYGTYITKLSFGQNSKIAGLSSLGYIDLTTLPTNKIVISENITSLDDYAFANVKDFSSIFEFEGFAAITSIGAYAFSNSTGIPSDFSSLTSLTTLNANTFQNTTFIDGADAELILPEGITSIGRYALSNLNIKKLYIPSSVETIGDYALSGSTFGELFAPFMKKDQVGHFYNAIIKRFTLLEGETTMYESTDLYTFKFNDGLEYVCLPSTLTEIPDGIFSRQTSLTEVVITDTSSNPSKLITIGSQAFEYCSALQSIVLPNSVKVISSSAFSGCSSLSQVNMPTALETISSYAFKGCALTEVIIPASVTTIGLGAFNNCPITFAYLPTTITNINGAIFMGAPNNIVIATNGASTPAAWGTAFCRISDTVYKTPTYNYDITQR